MPAMVDTMAYAGETPWHGLGFPVNNNLSPEGMLKAAHCDWGVKPTELFFVNKKGEFQLWEDTRGLLRVTDEMQLSPIGTGFKPVQNVEAVSFFSNFVKVGNMRMETLGSLWEGRYIWALASLEKSFNLLKGTKKAKSKGGDTVKCYLLMSSPHLLGSALIFKFTTIRVVCWNTYSAALGRGIKKNDKKAIKKGEAELFKVAHSQPFDDGMKKRVEMALGLADKQFNQFEEQATLLANTKISKDDTFEYFCEVAQWDPDDADNKEKLEKGKLPKDIERYQTALLNAPGQELPSALGTYWGAFNAVTNSIDFAYSDNAETRLKTAWFGNQANVKQRALDIALDKAGWKKEPAAVAA